MSCQDILILTYDKKLEQEVSEPRPDKNRKARALKGAQKVRRINKAFKEVFGK